MGRIVDPFRGLQRLPRVARYGLTVLIVLVFFLIRRSLGESLQGYPFLLFFPSIIICAALFDRGSGVLADLLSTVLSVTYSRPPGTFYIVAHLLRFGLAGEFGRRLNAPPSSAS